MRPVPAIVLATLLGAWPLAAHSTAAEPSGSTVYPPRPAPAVGKPYGPLVLPTLDGSRTVSLDVYRGRKVLLIEFASW